MGFPIEPKITIARSTLDEFQVCWEPSTPPDTHGLDFQGKAWIPISVA